MHEVKKIKDLLETYEIVKEAREIAEIKRKEVLTDGNCRAAFTRIYDFFDEIVGLLENAGMREYKIYSQLVPHVSVEISRDNSFPSPTVTLCCSDDDRISRINISFDSAGAQYNAIMNGYRGYLPFRYNQLFYRILRDWDEMTDNVLHSVSDYVKNETKELEKDIVKFDKETLLYSQFFTDNPFEN